MSKTTDSISSTCVLCCQDAKLFAIGPCDHPICTKCSTRMRVLCEQKYCSVCRNEMGTVLFVKKVHPYASIISHKFLSNKKAGIRFASGWMKSEFEDYLSHKCPKCPKDVNQFKSLKLLEEHMRRNHELFYCNLCVDNVKTDSKASDIDSDSTRTRMPPGFPLQATDSIPKRYPPGLSLPTTIPPPGFDKGSTFNPPPRFSVASVFVEPSNFKQRNMDLIDKIRTHLNYDVDGFNKFKRLSGQFRQGNLSGKDYYENCSGLLGKDNFQNIFPDLVSLLPDTEKQQELLLVNNDYKILAKNTGEKVLSIKKKGSSVWSGQGQNENTMCNSCGQVLLQKDLSSHMDICSKNTDFPSLAAASASSAPRQTATAWGRVK
ncbi:E3 ubiquitin-protein ligase ZNF598-like [Anneissia japonica]|uniref:E3 ubiquitin-protein ligase ZNF598-like n=1 Tax=Anneissia japonica TaxID=1529436 RepID=UPI00142579DD|nr:E3 ubiquitin-protein ligase ZNF598-like [Anneissia japonica]